jgi:glutathione S-transferase
MRVVMRATLFGLASSHPTLAAELMLRHKGIEYRRLDLMPWLHRGVLRAIGFPGITVPAVRLEGTRLQGTRTIALALDALQPSPPLFPLDPERRRAVEDAEAWGDEVLQPVPRRLLRWALVHNAEARRRFVEELGMPFEAVAVRAMVPTAAWYARREEAGSTDRIRADWAAAPGHLDHVDDLIAGGVIGGADLNAADFQLGTTLRVMLALEDFAPLLADRPAARLARRVWPDYPYAVPTLRPRELRAATA